jgi:hypothetical protein
MLRFVLPALLLAVVAVAIAVTIAPMQALATPRGRLSRVAEEVDRIVIASSEIEPTDADKPRELTSADERRRFFDLLLLEPDVKEPCKCEGDVTFDFYRGDVLRVSLTLHHGERLRCEGRGADVLWQGDAVLTPEARKPLADRLTELEPK